MVDKTTIANMALDNIDHKSLIEDFSENSAEARRIRRWYDVCRIECLEASNWTFARKTEALATHSIAAPEERWAYRYIIPNGLIRARRIENPTGDNSSDPVPYAMEIASDGTKSLVTDQETATLIFTFDQQSTDFFSTSFTTALAHLLAARIAGPITRKRSIKQEQYNLYLTAIGAASANDANQEIQRRPREADWIEGRV